MKAFFQGPNRRQFALQTTFEDFLASGVMRRQALLNMCQPQDVIADYLSPSADLDDPMELRETFAEACELATEGAVSSVELDAADISFIHQLFGNHLPPPSAQALALAA